MSPIAWIFVVVAIILGLAVSGYFLQHKLIYFPESELVATPADIGLEFEEISFAAQDGVQLHGWFVPAIETDLVVLFCHGNAGNISHRLETIETFHNLGLSVFIFDYRGFGQSQGSPSEEGTYKDVRAAWRYLLHKKQLAPGKILLWGRSLGGPIAAAMAREDKPGGLVLESTFTSLPEVAGRIYPFLPVKRFTRYRYPTREYLQDVSCPVLIMHSAEDDLIPYSFGKELFESAREPKRFLEMRGGHNEGHLVSAAEYARAVRAFISELVVDSSN